MNVKVTGEIDIAGVNNRFSSGIFSSVSEGSVGDGGSITIDTGSFRLRDGAKISASMFGQGNGGDVIITAQDTVLLTSSVIRSPLSGIGKGGNVVINAEELALQDGAEISTSTFGKGNAGNVILNAKDTISLSGQPTAIFSNVESGSVGKGGDINISATSLSIEGSAQIQTISRRVIDNQPAGIGDAGDVNVEVTGKVDIAGVKNGFSSGIFSRVEAGTKSNGGDISIDAGSFRLRDGALLDARTQNNKLGGNIQINANVFEILNGGQLLTITSNNGVAGKVTVNATEKVIISGSDPNFNDRVTNFPNLLENIGANSGFFVSSIVSGTTGDIEITSPTIALDNTGTLNAESTSGNGGNINLRTDLLLLRRGAQISTNAGTAQQGGDGGNIDINSKFIVAIPQENSDITANAFSGDGGNVDILSQGIFGIEPRQQESDLTSDITASSELGIGGTIFITTPDNDGIQNDLADLPNNQIDPNVLIANSCINRTENQNSTFFITGKGGIPVRPDDAPLPTYSTGTIRSLGTTNSRSKWKIGDPVVEPTGVYKLPNGKLVLSRECS